MIKLVYTFACLLCATAATAQETKPFTLTPEDQAVVERSVADETAMPERTRVTGVAASITPEGGVSACGYVKWIDGSGLYGPYRPFNGVLATNKAGERVFVVVSIARDAQSHDIIETLCAQDGMPIRPGSVAADAAPLTPTDEFPEGIAEMIAIARDLDSRCRGTEGADPTSTACKDRDIAFKAVRFVGWCYGREGEFGYQHDWYPCGAGSYGYSQ